MRETLLIIHYSDRTDSERALSKIADFLGVSSEFLRCEQFGPSTFDQCEKHFKVAMSGDTLALLHERGMLDLIISLIIERKTSLFLYGVSSLSSFEEALRKLTAERVRKATPAKGKRVIQLQLSSCHRHILGELSGLSFPLVRSVSSFAWLLQSDRLESCLLLTVDNNPFFIRLSQADSEIFLVCNNIIQNIDVDIRGEPNLKEYFLDLFPALIFIKYAFRGYCWEGAHKHACLIIDDPLVKDRYGYIDFGSLVSVMNKYNFCCSIGFIPWNYRRSKKSTIDLLKNSLGRLSLCVHGCDHTKAEFGSDIYAVLDGKLRVAISRMQEHHCLTGLSYDKVMVFPQGVFSETAMEVLKHHNFLAAINFEVIPYLATDSQPLRHFLQPAMMQYSSFPLYIRRNPEQIADLAIDSYLDRPVLIMTHQESFKDKYRLIIDSVQRINSIHSSLKWVGVSDLCMGTYQMKKEPDGTISTRLFSTRTIITDTLTETITAAIVKEEVDSGAIHQIVVNGRHVEHTFSNNRIEFFVELDKFTPNDIQIIYNTRNSGDIYKSNIAQRTRVFFRRHLCEMRDYGVSLGNTVLSRIRFG